MQQTFSQLAERVDAALSSAAATNHRSALLLAASERLRHGGYTTVCAWCGAFSLGADFFPPREEPEFLRHAKVTHGICPTCLGALRRSGLSN